MILDEIIRDTMLRVEKAKRERPVGAKEAAAAPARPLDFAAALSRGGVNIIAEVKKASPSKGVIRKDFDAVALATAYERGGAAAISVLTEEKYFQGSLAYLEAVKAKTAVPVLRKEFIIDPYQIYEARAAGADALLLIVAALDDARLKDFIALSTSLAMASLVEAHDEAELERALKAGAKVVGVNNRDLKTFRVDIDTTVRLAPFVPDDVVLVAESGISAPGEIIRLKGAGVDAFLIGEALSREPDPEATLKALIAGSMKAA